MPLKGCAKREGAFALPSFNRVSCVAACGTQRLPAPACRAVSTRSCVVGELLTKGLGPVTQGVVDDAWQAVAGPAHQLSMERHWSFEVVSSSVVIPWRWPWCTQIRL